MRQKKLDKVATLIDVPIEAARLVPIGTRGNYRLRAAGRDGVDQGIGVVRFVRSNRLGGNAGEQRFRFADIRCLPRCQAPAGEVAEAFDQGMDLGGQPSTGATDRWRTFFFSGPSRVLMRANDRAIDENFLKIRITGQLGKDPLPHTAFFPAGKPLIHAVPAPELLRQIAPRYS